MKKLFLYIFISSILMLFMACPPPSRINYCDYIVETEVPIYYAVSKEEPTTFKKLEAFQSVKFKANGKNLTLCQNSDGTGVFYTLPLSPVMAYSKDEEILFWVFEEKDLKSRGLGYQRNYSPSEELNSLRLVSYGWEYSESENSYILKVDKDMFDSSPVNFYGMVEFTADEVRHIEGFWGIFSGIPMLLIYMAADNDLYSAAIETINQLERGYIPYGYVYIFLDAPKGTPHEGGTFLQLVHDETPEIKSKVLKTFGTIDSCDLEFFKKVSANLLWSHGTSWLPPSMRSDSINLNAFGRDDSHGSSLAVESMFPTIGAPIIFDSCCMASAEVVSCFNGTTVIAPSVDIEPLSYPYSDPEFLRAILFWDFEKAVDMIVDYNQKQGKEISMTYFKGENINWLRSDYNFSDFHDNLSSYLDTNYGTENSKLDFATMRPSLLPLGTTKPGKATLYYDLLSLIQEIEKGSSKTELQEALKKSVYVRSTPTIWNGQESSKYCGISCYVPYHYEEDISQDLVNLNQYYLTLPWGEMIGKYCKPLVP